MSIKKTPNQQERQADTSLTISETDKKGISNKIDLFSMGILNSLTAHIAVVDSTGNIIAVNNAWKSFANKNSDRSDRTRVGTNYFDACAKATDADGRMDAASAVTGIKKVLSGKLHEFEMEYDCHSPKKQRWFLMRATPMDFRGQKAVITHIDITEKKLTQIALTDKKKELDSLHIINRKVSSSISLKDIIQTIIDQITQTLEPDLAMLYLREGDRLMLKGLNTTNLETGLDMDTSHVVGECLCGLSASSATPVFSTNIHEDDRCTWPECKKAGIVSFASIPLNSRKGVIGTFGIGSKSPRDFSKHQDFLEALANDISIFIDNSLLYEKAKTSKKELEQQLSERRDMEKTIRQSQKMEAIGTLAGGIAHDFNNILTPLLGYTELLQMDLPDDKQLKQRTQEILKAALRAKELVSQILTFSRQDERKRSAIKLQPLVKETIKLLEASIPTTITIKTQIDPECGKVMADSTQIHQVILNLATNAYHAMKESGGLLNISLKSFPVDPGLSRLLRLPMGDYALLTVADTGTGIPENMIDKIFDPYFTTKKEHQGTGLGLSVVQGIIKREKGDIKVQSTVGEGTWFNVYLPIITESAAREEKIISKSIPHGSERILLVDDEKAIVNLQKEMLERLGYQVTSLTDSKKAFETFQADPGAFDLLMTDMTMPYLTGIQLIRRIKQIKPSIPVILCTGYNDQINKQAGKQLDIQGFLIKPTTMSQIAHTIKTIFKDR